MIEARRSIHPELVFTWRSTAELITAVNKSDRSLATPAVTLLKTAA